MIRKVFLAFARVLAGSTLAFGSDAAEHHH